MLRLLDNTKTCRQICQLETICVLVRWILKNHRLFRNPWHLLCVPRLPSGIVVDPSQNTSTRWPSKSVLVIEPVRRDSDVPIDDSSVAPGSMQISPRELTRSQGELVRSFVENADPTTVRRRIVGKRTIIPLVLLALSDNVDSVSVPDCLPVAGLPEALEPSDGGTKKRRVESFDESVDWFQRERSSTAWLRNSSGERKYLRLTLVIHWNLKSPSVECRRCGCQRDCRMGNRLRLRFTVHCLVNS